MKLYWSDFAIEMLSEIHNYYKKKRVLQLPIKSRMKFLPLHSN